MFGIINNAMESQTTPSKLAYLPVKITNPETRVSVFVNARVADYEWFGFIADLGQEVVNLLRLEAGRQMDGVDDLGLVEANELYHFQVNKVHISLHEHNVIGDAITNSTHSDTILFPNFLKDLPKSFNLTRYHSVQPMRYIFLSHSHKDKRFARSLAHSLKNAGIGVWIDEAEIKVGESLVEKLRAAIDVVDFVVAIISPTSIKSAWVQKEIDVAINQEVKRTTRLSPRQDLR
jgi:hypothetical protein